MNTENNLPFAEILASLFAEEMGPIHYLYRLSDMSEDEHLQFDASWKGVSDNRRHEIVRHLADISESNFVVDFSPIFRSSFLDPFAPVRVAALDGLWDSTDSTLVNPILELLTSDPDPVVREAAAKSLAHFLLLSEWGQVRGINTQRVFQKLLAIYEHPLTTLRIKCAVLEAMGPIPLNETTRIIEDAYEVGVEELQLSAIFAMGTSADSRWLSILLDEMESPSVDMRAEAARAAGIIGKTEAIPQLAELSYDEDLDVATTSVIALAQIGGDEANHILNVLLADQEMKHVHEAIEEALEESQWLDGELPMMPWSEENTL
ncbi:MAG: HEAT repeat domain-containing protein [Candidatus Promineifilaceae bacterium]|nr:HEAT repeat domain-containing protein [Candidatus Promineifilaceae bacterium]